MKNLKNKHLLKILQKSFESKRAVKVTFNYPGRRTQRTGMWKVKFVCADLPHPNSAEEDSYGGGRGKKSAAGASTTTTRSRQ